MAEGERRERRGGGEIQGRCRGDMGEVRGEAPAEDKLALAGLCVGGEVVAVEGAVLRKGEQHPLACPWLHRHVGDRRRVLLQHVHLGRVRAGVRVRARARDRVRVRVRVMIEPSRL